MGVAFSVCTIFSSRSDLFFGMNLRFHTLPLSAQAYKRVPGNLMVGMTLLWGSFLETPQKLIRHVKPLLVYLYLKTDKAAMMRLKLETSARIKNL